MKHKLIFLLILCIGIVNLQASTTTPQTGPNNPFNKYASDITFIAQLAEKIINNTPMTNKEQADVINKVPGLTLTPGQSWTWAIAGMAGYLNKSFYLRMLLSEFYCARCAIGASLFKSPALAGSNTQTKANWPQPNYPFPSLTSTDQPPTPLLPGGFNQATLEYFISMATTYTNNANALRVVAEPTQLPDSVNPIETFAGVIVVLTQNALTNLGDMTINNTVFSSADPVYFFPYQQTSTTQNASTNSGSTNSGDSSSNSTTLQSGSDDDSDDSDSTNSGDSNSDSSVPNLNVIANSTITSSTANPSPAGGATPENATGIQLTLSGSAQTSTSYFGSTGILATLLKINLTNYLTAIKTTKQNSLPCYLNTIEIQTNSLADNVLTLCTYDLHKPITPAQANAINFFKKIANIPWALVVQMDGTVVAKSYTDSNGNTVQSGTPNMNSTILGAVALNPIQFAQYTTKYQTSGTYNDIFNAPSNLYYSIYHTADGAETATNPQPIQRMPVSRLLRGIVNGYLTSWKYNPLVTPDLDRWKNAQQAVDYPIPTTEQFKNNNNNKMFYALYGSFNGLNQLYVTEENIPNIVDIIQNPTTAIPSCNYIPSGLDSQQSINQAVAQLQTAITNVLNLKNSNLLSTQTSALTQAQTALTNLQKTITAGNPAAIASQAQSIKKTLLGAYNGINWQNGNINWKNVINSRNNRNPVFFVKNFLQAASALQQSKSQKNIKNVQKTLAKTLTLTSLMPSQRQKLLTAQKDVTNRKNLLAATDGLQWVNSANTVLQNNNAFQNFLTIAWQTITSLPQLSNQINGQTTGQKWSYQTVNTAINTVPQQSINPSATITPIASGSGSSNPTSNPTNANANTNANTNANANTNTNTNTNSGGTSFTGITSGTSSSTTNSDSGSSLTGGGSGTSFTGITGGSSGASLTGGTSGTDTTDNDDDTGSGTTDGGTSFTGLTGGGSGTSFTGITGGSSGASLTGGTSGTDTTDNDDDTGSGTTDGDTSFTGLTGGGSGTGLTGGGSGTGLTGGTSGSGTTDGGSGTGLTGGTSGSDLTDGTSGTSFTGITGGSSGTGLTGGGSGTGLTGGYNWGQTPTTPATNTNQTSSLNTGDTDDDDSGTDTADGGTSFTGLTGGGSESDLTDGSSGSGLTGGTSGTAPQPQPEYPTQYPTQYPEQQPEQYPEQQPEQYRPEYQPQYRPEYQSEQQPTADDSSESDLTGGGYNWGQAEQTEDGWNNSSLDNNDSENSGGSPYYSLNGVAKSQGLFNKLLTHLEKPLQTIKSLFLKDNSKNERIV